MSDRYAKIREALALGPSPGPWEWKEVITMKWDGKEWSIASVEWSRLGWHENRRCESLEAGANAALVAACDPDTIRELLAERDALAAETERLRQTLKAEIGKAVQKWGDLRNDDATRRGVAFAADILRAALKEASDERA